MGMNEEWGKSPDLARRIQSAERVGPGHYEP